MRRWLLVFMILLLPVRGLVGEAMAGQMLQEQARHAGVAAAAPAEAGHHAPAAAHDCAGHGEQASAAADTEASPSDCPTCASCQVCSSVALSAPPFLAPTLAFSGVQPRGVEHAYASAEPGLAFKPPRS